MSKRIHMQVRPQGKTHADDWVDNRQATAGTQSRAKPKRLTIDINPDLHTRLKVHCASNGLQIADLLRRLIDDEVA